jgi:hypothetical protein
VWYTIRQIDSSAFKRYKTCHAIYRQKARINSKDIDGSARLTAGCMFQWVKYLDMFRAILCSSSGGQNCIFTASGIIILCKRPYSAPVARNMSRYLMQYVYYRIKKMSMTLVIKNKSILWCMIRKTSKFNIRHRYDQTIRIERNNSYMR